MNFSIKVDTLPTVDCGDEVADWLCRYFKRPGLRLHFSAPSLEKRDSSKVKKPWTNPAKPGDQVCEQNASVTLVFVFIYLSQS